MDERMAKLVAEVRAHALKHYWDGGWDVLVECWDKEDIVRQIGRARTLKGAIRNVWKILQIYAERQSDARYYAENW